MTRILYTGAKRQRGLGKHKGRPVKPIDHLYQEGIKNRKFLLAELKVCSSTRNLRRGIEVRAEAIESGSDSCIYVATALVSMYAKCGSMVDAREVFDHIKNPDIVSWNALILGYAENDQGLAALKLFARMKFQGFAPNSITFVAALKACTSLAKSEFKERVKQIHSEIGCHLNTHVQNTLIGMYSKCGSMVDARQAFDSIEEANVISWNILILGYIHNGEAVTALEIFAEMRSRGCPPNNITFVAALRACTSLALGQDEIGRRECRDLGKKIHSEVMLSDIYVESTLIDMYAKCGSMVDAHKVFDTIKHPNLVSWNALISGYADNKEGFTALDLFARMKSEGCAPDCITYVAALKACTSLALERNEVLRAECRKRGKEIHLEIGTSNTNVQNTLIGMYSKCGSMVESRQVFDGIKHPDVVSWTALIFGYAENGEGDTALDLFARMRSQGCAPNSVTFVAALKACASLALEQDGSRKAECRERGKQIHIEIGFHSDIYVQSTLIDMYSKCGSMPDAYHLFSNIENPDVVAWNALILGYVENGDGVTALDLFARMKWQGHTPNSITFIAALKACASLCLRECRDRVRQLHLEIGSSSNSFVQSTLVDMYSKCGSMADARQVFDTVKHPDVVLWNALILGYAENGDSGTSLDLFARMNSQGCAPNSVTFIAALKACGLLVALEAGSKIHAKLYAEIDEGTEHNASILVTCLVDFYAKCGSLEEAEKVFDSFSKRRNLKTWNSLLAGYSRLGDSNSVFRLFERMQDAGFQPDGVTFLCILTCCSHAGLVGKANEFLDAMATNYGMSPAIEHYTCMVDMYGRLNRLDDAIVWLQSMPCRPSAVTWMALLSACHKWENVGIGRLAFKSLLSLDDANSAAYVLMAQIYGSSGLWEEKEMVLGMGKKLKAWNKSEQSFWTNEAGEVQTFFNGDNNHPQIHNIQEKLEMMIENHGHFCDFHSPKLAGYECGHSEKLALACAILNTKPGRTVRIVKNLRVCDLCHIFMAVSSKLEDRSIICKDESMFHVFKDGKCSCTDVW